MLSATLKNLQQGLSVFMNKAKGQERKAPVIRQTSIDNGDRGDLETTASGLRDDQSIKTKSVSGPQRKRWRSSANSDDEEEAEEEEKGDDQEKSDDEGSVSSGVSAGSAAALAGDNEENDNEEQEPEAKKKKKAKSEHKSRPKKRRKTKAAVKFSPDTDVLVKNPTVNKLYKIVQQLANVYDERRYTEDEIMNKLWVTKFNDSVRLHDQKKQGNLSWDNFAEAYRNYVRPDVEAAFEMIWLEIRNLNHYIFSREDTDLSIIFKNKDLITPFIGWVRQRMSDNHNVRFVASVATRAIINKDEIEIYFRSWFENAERLEKEDGTIEWVSGLAAAADAASSDDD